MRRSKLFFRWLSGWLLLCLLGVAILGGAGLSVRAAPQKQAALSVIINEVAWAGTQASSDDDWIELHNPSLTDPVDISDWELISNTFSITFPTPTIIPADDYYLIERRQQATSVTSNLVFPGLLMGNSGDTLRLRKPDGTLVDSANSNGGEWPAGNSSSTATMQRGAVVADNDLAWVTYNQTDDPLAGSELDASGATAILGTPGRSNWPANVTATPTFTSTSTFTPISTSTSTQISMTPTQTATATPLGRLSIVINEVAWAGTTASVDDDWIELYNPTAINVDISGWRLVGNSFTVEFPEGTIISTNDRYYLIERHENVTNITSDLIYTDLIFSNNNERLYLYNDENDLIDSANSNSGPWPAGEASTYSSMQRSVIAADSNFVWVTYYPSADSSANIAKDARGNNIRGTPGRGNLPINVTTTSTPTLRPTARPGTAGSIPTPAPVIGISEFLPRPGHDWNNDGKVDVFDEFIEIINAGRGDVNLSAYRLDDEQIGGSVPYTLPNITLKPDERAVFYASETGILLSDGGDTVRLLRGNTVIDAYTYTVVRYPDQSWCRIPDRLGYWNHPCFPTPNNANALTGRIPLPSGGPTGYRPPVCLLPDTTPDEFIYAECEVGGSEIWNRQYWDDADASEYLKLKEEQKWETVFE